jgi:hypothetical protein
MNINMTVLVEAKKGRFRIAADPTERFIDRRKTLKPATPLFWRQTSLSAGRWPCQSLPPMMDATLAEHLRRAYSRPCRWSGDFRQCWQELYLAEYVIEIAEEIDRFL